MGAAEQIQIQIKLMSPDQVLQACEVLGAAFARNPTTIAIFRSDPNTARCARAAFIAMLTNSPGRVFVAERDGQIVGVMRTVARQSDTRVSFAGRLRALTSLPLMGKAPGGLGGFGR